MQFLPNRRGYLILRLLFPWSDVAYWLSVKMYFWVGLSPQTAGAFFIFSSVFLNAVGWFWLGEPFRVSTMLPMVNCLPAAATILRIREDGEDKNDQNDAMKVDDYRFIYMMGDGRKAGARHWCVFSVYYGTVSASMAFLPPISGAFTVMGGMLLAIGLWMLITSISGGQRGRLWENIRQIGFFRARRLVTVPIQS